MQAKWEPLSPVTMQAEWESLSPVTIVHPPRGGALIVTLLLLTLLALLACPWLMLSMNEGAQAGQYAAQGALDGALYSALEHAKASASGANTDGSLAGGPRDSSGGWVVLDSNAVCQTRYRWTVVANAALDAGTLPWPSAQALLAARTVWRNDGWQPVTDPLVAPLADLVDASRAELVSCSMPEQRAEELALTIADAYDANGTLSTLSHPHTLGHEGFSLAAVWRGDEQVVPAAAFLRQSYFYAVPVDDIFRAFIIAAVDPWYDADAGVTNTRIRLSASPLKSDASWRLFTNLWHTVYDTPFIPHAWRGLAGRIVMECGGHGDAVSVIDNDGDAIYLKGHPLEFCRVNRFFTLDLCDATSVPGALAAAAPGIDVWFATNVLAGQEYLARFVHGTAAARPAMKLVNGASLPARTPAQAGDANAGAWRRIRTAASPQPFVAYEVSCVPGMSVAGLHLRQGDAVVWRNESAAAQYVSGWRWSRESPEGVADTVTFNNGSDVRGGLVERQQSFDVPPGALWFWATDATMLPGGLRGVMSPVSPGGAGKAYVVERCAPVRSPYGGIAWRIDVLQHPGFRWDDDIWRGSVLRLDDGRADEGLAFVVYRNDDRTLYVHAGPASIAQQLSPRTGSIVRLGSLASCFRRMPGAVLNALGEQCARTPAFDELPPLTAWAAAEETRWRLTSRTPRDAPPAPRTAPLDETAPPSSQIASTPLWNRLSRAAGPAGIAAFAARLDERIAASGTWLPFAGARLAAGSAWRDTRAAVERAGAMQWRFVHLTDWPENFWEGCMLGFDGNGTRLRISASTGGHLTVDRPVQAAELPYPFLSPDGHAACYAAVEPNADGVWEFTLPDTVRLPADAYLSAFSPPETNAPPVFSVFLWNFPRAVWEPAAITNMLGERDTCSLGAVRRSNVGSHGVLRMRVISTQDRAWLRGLYLLSSHTAARPGDSAPRTDAYTARVEAEVLVRGRRAARRAYDAFLLREFTARAGRLQPRIICQEMRPLPAR